MRTRSQTEQHSASSKNSTNVEGNIVLYGMLENYYLIYNIHVLSS